MYLAIWTMKVNTWYYNFGKIQQRIFSAFLRIAFLPDNDDMQSALTEACNLSLMAIGTFFFCSWVVKSLCSNLSVFLPSVLCFYLHIDKITHSTCIIFLNMCKMKKIPLCWNMMPWFQQMWKTVGCFFLFIVSSSLHSALASVKCSGHQWLLSGLITIWKTGKIQ